MPIRRVTAPRAPAELITGLHRLAEELGLPGDFPSEVQAEAAELARTGPIDRGQRTDLTRLPFITIDPPGSTDLDQALHIERQGAGYRVWYAITDLAAWIRPGGAIDQEAQRRGQTFYAPTWRIPLHPPALSENAASLLPDGVARPALVWRIDLASDGDVRQVEILKADVVSHAQRSYAQVQADLDAGMADEAVQLLREVGIARQQVEIDRGGVSLDLPDQEVVAHHDGWHLEFRRVMPVEGWNAQISLLTGISAAHLMLDAGVGILRTLPPARQYDVDRLRRIAKSLRLRWPGAVGYPEFVRSLSPAEPDGQAMLNASTTLFRGAAYTVLNGQGDQLVVHGALATPYAHTTAPLRRLVDRHVGALCAELCAGRPAPEWVLADLADLPARMAASGQKARRFERGTIDRVEAVVLQGREGATFAGTIVELDRPGRGSASVPRVAVEAPVEGRGLVLGSEQILRLARADVETGKVLFVPA
ncbi:MAG: ribonuclease catalytic domain-containing protein [Brooklawnia sp.]|jgi:exoribonuclease R